MRAFLFSALLLITLSPHGYSCSPPICSPRKTAYKELSFKRLQRTQNIRCEDTDSSYVKVDTLFYGDMVESFLEIVNTHSEAYIVKLKKISPSPDPEIDTTTYEILFTLKGSDTANPVAKKLTNAGMGGDCTFKLLKEGGILLSAFNRNSEWALNNGYNRDFFYMKSFQDMKLYNDHWKGLVIDLREFNMNKFSSKRSPPSAGE